MAGYADIQYAQNELDLVKIAYLHTHGWRTDSTHKGFWYNAKVPIDKRIYYTTEEAIQLVRAEEIRS